MAKKAPKKTGGKTIQMAGDKNPDVALPGGTSNRKGPVKDYRKKGTGW